MVVVIKAWSTLPSLVLKRVLKLVGCRRAVSNWTLSCDASRESEERPTLVCCEQPDLHFGFHFAFCQFSALCRHTDDALLRCVVPWNSLKIELR